MLMIPASQCGFAVRGNLLALPLLFICETGKWIRFNDKEEQMSRARSFRWFTHRSGRDRITALSFVALGLGLLTQLAWMLGTDRDDGFGIIKLVNVVGFALLAITGTRSKFVVVLMRAVLALTFLGSVADRFGLLGNPGAAGIAWGSFSHFVDYTRDVTSFLPSSWAPALAVMATIAETCLGFGLVFGKWQRMVAFGATGLLGVFGLSMTLSLGIASPFSYSVWLLATGALVLSRPIASHWFPAFIIQRRHGNLAPTRSRTVECGHYEP